MLWYNMLRQAGRIWLSHRLSWYTVKPHRNLKRVLRRIKSEALFCGICGKVAILSGCIFPFVLWMFRMINRNLCTGCAGAIFSGAYMFLLLAKRRDFFGKTVKIRRPTWVSDDFTVKTLIWCGVNLLSKIKYKLQKNLKEGFIRIYIFRRRRTIFPPTMFVMKGMFDAYSAIASTAALQYILRRTRL